MDVPTPASAAPVPEPGSGADAGSDGAEAPSVSVDELVARLKEKVEERRRSGEYPPGLEHDLDAHFRRVAAFRSDGYLDELRARTARLEWGVSFDPARIRYESGVPGGRLVHRAVGKVVSRQTQGILEQVQELTDAVRDAVRALTAALEDPRGHRHHDLSGQIDAALERLATYEREPVDTTMAIADLRRRVDELEEAARRSSLRPWFDSERFEAAFRGEEDELVDRYRDLVKRFDGCSPVVDIGCGRGEVLALLGELGLEAIGVEIDPALAQACRDRGLRADVGDGLAWLEGSVDGSLGGISLVQVVEHLSQQEIVELVALAARKLRPGGRIVMETVNPQSLYVYAHAFYLDPTHTRPVHPAYLTFLLREAGFRDVGIDWRSPPPAADLLDDTGGEQPAFDANVAKLNALLFAPQDYAAYATR